jgi:hypothetical protein
MESALRTTIPITAAQAGQLAHWREKVQAAEQALQSCRDCYVAALSIVVAGSEEGVWNVDAIEFGENPHITVSRPATEEVIG